MNCDRPCPRSQAGRTSPAQNGRKTRPAPPLSQKRREYAEDQEDSGEDENHGTKRSKKTPAPHVVRVDDDIQAAMTTTSLIVTASAQASPPNSAVALASSTGPQLQEILVEISQSLRNVASRLSHLENEVRSPTFAKLSPTPRRTENADIVNITAALFQDMRSKFMVSFCEISLHTLTTSISDTLERNGLGYFPLGNRRGLLF